jgi:hypothetical protein
MGSEGWLRTSALPVTSRAFFQLNYLGMDKD